MRPHLGKGGNAARLEPSGDVIGNPIKSPS
jgi:hypothetical protein